MKNIQKLASIVVIGIIVISLNTINGFASPLVEAGTSTPSPSPDYFSSEQIQLEDGTELELTIINGPPEPPGGRTPERLSSTIYDLSLEGGTHNLNVPAYNWSFGCSPTSGSMIAAYSDRNGFTDIYTAG